jgi:thiol-disulfide isomerase/thioredoxin
MRRRAAILAGITLVVAALDIGLRTRRERAAAVTTRTGLHMLDVPMPLASFAALDLQGREVTPAQWRGRFALVNVWATWCVPCRAEIPDLVALQNQHRDSLQVIGVLQDAPTAQADRLIAALHINYPIVVSTSEIDLALGETLVLPTSYVIDPEGRIIATQAGRIDPQSIAALVTRGFTQKSGES